MANAQPRIIVAVLDRRLLLYMAGAAMGIVLYIVAVLGEFVFHWWNDVGLFLAVGSLFLTIVLGLIAASRFQVDHLGREIRAVGAGVGRVEASTQRIEANTAGLPRMEVLLREIRDRLPPPP